MSQTNERAFENYVEEILLGKAGWQSAAVADWDVDRALFPRDVCTFLRETTLSRLNRMIPGKDAPFVLDFVNDAENILRAFKPYYDKTALAEASDPSQLETLKHELDHAQVFHWSDVRAFARVFYKPVDKQEPADHARMQGYLQPSVERFRGIDDEDEVQEFRDRPNGYVKLYAFLSQIIPYTDEELEMLYSYGRLLTSSSWGFGS